MIQSSRKDIKTTTEVIPEEKINTPNKKAQGSEALSQSRLKDKFEDKNKTPQVKVQSTLNESLTKREVNAPTPKQPFKNLNTD